MHALCRAESKPGSQVLYFLLRRCSAYWIVFCLCVLGVYGQAPNRISQIINLTQSVPLQGSVAPLARIENDIGHLSGETRLSGVTIYFRLTAQQQAELDALVQAQQTPGSPSYHKWLTPAEYASRFGLSDSDLEKIQTWLELQGFIVDCASESRTSIRFSGTVGQVELAFQTEIHHYDIGGETHFANATQLSIPVALSDVIQAVRNLNDFRPKPQVRFRKPSPDFTSGQTGNHYLTPKDVATIYDVNAAYNSSYNGTGQSIAIVGQSEVEVSDVEHFQSAAGLTIKDPTLVLVPNSGSAKLSTGDESESDLDLEYSGGMGTGATIYFVYVGDNPNYGVFDSVQYAVDTRIAPIISISYGACETDLSSNDFSTLESIMEQGASQGQSIIAASGDNGSTSCYSDSSLTTAQQEALAVNYPASSAYVTGLGGTEFPSSDVSSSNTTYWQSANGSDLVNSAKSYIPEQTWNDDSSSNSQNPLAAGGGGTSALTARPSWQTGVPGILSGSYRLVPDISLSSSPVNAGYLYCSSDSQATGITGSCTNGFRDSSDKYVTVAGGTSFAAPIFAGMLSIINQKENSTGQGVVNSTLYKLAANSSTYASAFHDITSGGNQCTLGAQYCSSAGASKYPATTGYDEATGLGSIDLNNLMSAWTAGSGSSLQPTVTALTAATSTPASGANDTVTITVTPESNSITTTPTGTLTILVDGTIETSSLALSNGSATYTFSSTASGTHVIQGKYSGDSTFAASTGSVPVNVGGSGGSGSGTFTLSAANITVAQGISGTSAVTVTSQNSYAGTVGFTLSTSSTSVTEYGCYNISDATVAANKSATTTLTFYTSKSDCTSSGSVRGGTVRRFVKMGGHVVADSSQSSSQHGSIPLSSMIALAGLAVLRVRRRLSRSWASLAFLILLASVGLVAIGCGGGSGGNSNDVPKGTYTLTLDGTDTSNSSLAASTTLTLTVQ